MVEDIDVGDVVDKELHNSGSESNTLAVNLEMSALRKVCMKVYSIN